MLFNCVLVFMIMAETQLNPAEAKGGIYCNWAVKQTRGKGELRLEGEERNGENRDICNSVNNKIK